MSDNFPILIEDINGIKKVKGIFEPDPNLGVLARIVDSRVTISDPKLINTRYDKNYVLLDNRYQWVAYGSVMTSSENSLITVSAKQVEEEYRQKHYYDLVIKNCKLFSDDDVDKIFNEMRKKNTSTMFERKLCDTILGQTHDNQICYTYHTPLSKDNEEVIREKLIFKPNGIRPLKESNIITVNDLHVTSETLISDEYTEKTEADKIMAWVSNELIIYRGNNKELFGKTIFSDLMQVFYKGYIYIARAGIDHVDTVRFESIPGQIPSNVKTPLQFFEYQVNKPLSRILLLESVRVPEDNTCQPATADCFPKLSGISDEALKLLSVENYICLQPQPRYFLYILKRLIFAWYADIDLSSSILKIKVLVNQYRARRDVDINLKLGVEPMIMIYLRYGDNQLDKAFQKINYYFTNYINTGWEGNDPDYFFKFNSLLYLSNGSPDAKKYFDSKNMDFVYKPFTQSHKAYLKYSNLTIAPFPISR